MSGGEVLYNLIRDILSLTRGWSDLSSWEKRIWEKQAVEIAVACLEARAVDPTTIRRLKRKENDLLNEVLRWDYATP